MRNLFLFFIFIALAGTANAQELQARFTIVSNKVSTTVDKKIFSSLQTALTNFVNNRKWTNDVFQPQEKIKCNFLLTIDEYMAYLRALCLP